MKRIVTLIVVLVASFCSLNAQSLLTNQCESTPCNALPICGIGNKVQPNSFVSTGNPQGTCGANFFTGNWVYYRMTCFAPGVLAFTITPNDVASDLNWALWDITVTGCSAMSSTTNCNANTLLGGTGMAVVPPSAAFSASATLVAGNTYILGVQRNTGGTVTPGFTINFTGTTASLTDAAAPALASFIPFDVCLPVTQVRVKTTEPVRCTQVDPTDFVISNNPTFTVGGASCSGCSNTPATAVNFSNYEDTLLFNFPTALAPGNYTINLAAAANFRDVCNNLPNVTPTVTFTVPIPLDLDVDTGYNCTAQTYIDSVQGLNSVGPYQYKCKGGTQSNTYGTATMSYNVFTGLTGGTSYTLYVRASNGCEDSVVIVHPPLIALQAPNLSTSASPPCYNQFALDSINVSPFFSGQGPYVFTIASTPATALTLGPATNPSPGKWKNLQFATGATFTVTVTDAWGCTKTASKNLINPTQLLLPLPTSTNPLCFGDSTGTMSPLGTGGTGVLTYTYAPIYAPPMLFANSSASHIGNLATNMAPGSYTVTVMDANGCTAAISKTIASNPQIVVKTTNTPAPVTTFNPTCLNTCGGRIKPFATGGLGTKKNYYLYPVWPGPAVDSVIYNPVFGSTDSFFNGTILQPSGLCAGTYTVVAVDQAGCTATGVYTLTLPTYPDLVLDSINDVNCFGGCTGRIYTTTSVATGPFTYSITPTTSGPCTASAFGSGDYQNLGAGTYQIIVTKAYGADQCRDTVSGVMISQPTALSFDSLTKTDVSCFNGNDGTAHAVVTGGTGLITYTISPLGPQSNTTGDFTNLTAQVYTVTGTDANGCAITSSVTLTHPTVLNLVISNIDSASCNGICDGEATATANGGTPIYTYYITAPGVIDTLTGDITNLCAGIYTVTAKDANNCTRTASFTVYEPAALAGSQVINNNVTCFGACDGQATVTTVGGTVPYSYTITGPGSPTITINVPTTQATINGLCVGAYVVTIEDAHNCTATVNINISQPPVLTAVYALVNNPLCTNACNGVATITPAGGTPAYNYTIAGNIGTPAINASGPVGTATGLCADTYTVTVSDAGTNCSTAVTFTIVDPPVLTIDTVSLVHASCNGDCNGIATMTSGGGTPVITYGITPTTNGTCNVTQVGNVFSGLWAGNYTVTASDGNGCQTTMSFTITQPNVFSIDTTSSTDVSCNGGCDGTAIMTFAGGTGPVGYLISPNVPCVATQLTVGNFGNLGSNLYTVTGTDAKGCIAATTFLIDQPTVLGLTITAGTSPGCNPGCDGTAQATANSGTPSYTYSILPASGTINSTTGAMTTLCAGITYTVTVVDSKNCNTNATIIMTTASSPSLAITAGTNPSCTPGCDGTSQATGSLGGGGYSYSISPASGTINASTGAMSTLCAGTNYVVTVTDVNGCTSTSNITMTTPNGPVVSITNVTLPTCSPGCDGTMSVSVSGGVGPYTYGIDNSATVAPVGPTAVTTAVGSGLCNNVTYVLTVTDVNSCVGIADTLLNQPAPPTVSVVTTTNVLCNGDCNGTAQLTSVGGTGLVTYGNLVWLNAMTCVPAQAVSGTFTGLGANTYTVTGTDASGCAGTVSFVITAPSVLTIDTVSLVHASCFGNCNGIATMTSGGGTPVITYGITPTTNGTCNVTQVGNVFSGLWAGTYVVTASDGNGCQTTMSFTITQPNVFSIDTTSSTDVSCNGGCDGTAIMTFAGGTGPVGYLISPNVPCVATQLTVGNFGNLGSNLYTVTGTDAKGCIAATTFLIDQPTVLGLTITAGTSPGCNPGCDGTAQATANSGTPSYTYSILPASGTINSTTGAMTTLCAGITYTVTVVDSKNCNTNATIIMTTASSPSLAITAGTNPSCTPGCDGTSQATGSLGGGGYSYSISPASGTINASTGAMSTLCAGTNYVVTVTDVNGCTSTSNITMTTPNGPVVSITNVTLPTCSPGCDGTMSVSVSGGVGPYTYGIDNSATVAPVGPTAVTTAVGSGLCNNVTYVLTVTDVNSCVGIADTLLNQPAPPTVSVVTTTNVLCNGDCNGTVQLTSVGGTGLVTYGNLVWLNAMTCVPAQAVSGTFTGLGANTYTVTGTDASGCTDTVSFVITAPSVLTIDTVSLVHASCNGDCNGIATMTSGGGTPVITYGITPTTNGTCNVTQVGNVFSGLWAGNYTVTASDGNGCQTTMSFTITQPNVFSIDTTSSTDVSCNGGCDGTAIMTFAGGTGPVGYLISPNVPCVATQLTVGNFGNLGSNLYTVTGTDAKGCTAAATFTITQPGALGLSITPGNIPSCNPGCDGTAQATANGGTTPYTYTISGATINAGTGAITAVCATISYTVTVTDAKFCSTTASFTMVTPNGPVPSITGVTIPGCSPNNNGTISISVAGGAPNYTYTISPSGTIAPVGPTASTTSTASGLVANVLYTITVTDNNDCVGSTSTTLSAPVPPVISTSSTSPVSCGASNGSATMSPAGLTYTVTGVGSPTVAGNVISNMAHSTPYTIIGTNAAGCADTLVISFVAPVGTPIDTLSTTKPSCNPGCDGIAVMTPTTGVTFTINPALPIGSIVGNTINNLCANTNYTITGTDALGCTFTKTITLTSPNAPAVTITGTNASGYNVANGTITVTNPILGATYDLYSVASASTILAGSLTGAFTGLAGDTTCLPLGYNYIVTVIDANGCTNTATICITEPTPSGCTFTTTNVTCNGLANGSLDVDANGGVGPWTFTMAPLPGNINTTTGIATNLPAGLYVVTGTDASTPVANTCVLNINITQPLVLGFNVPTVVSGTCTNQCSGTINVTATGGTLGSLGYTYSIQSPVGGCQAAQANPNAGSFTNVGTGTYTVSVTDSNSCSASVTIIVAPPTPPVINAINITPTTCNGLCNGQIIINATGANQYSINNGGNFQPSNTFNGLCAGIDTIVVQAANGCIDTAIVTVNEPPAVVMDSTSFVNPLCNNASTGSITAYASGGTGAIQYALNTTLPAYTLLNTFSNLAAGTYTVYARDANNCTVTAVITLANPQALFWDITDSTNITCFGLNNGSITVIAAGGTGNIDYALNNVAGPYSAGNNFSNLNAGVYTVYAKDANSCTISKTFNITQPPAINFNAPVVINNLCFGTSAGSIAITATGGTPFSYGYNYTISPIVGTMAQPSPGSFVNIPAGTYAITVTDSAGCSKTYTPSIVVTAPPQINLALVGKVDVKCFGDATGAITVSGNGGTGLITFNLQPGNVSNNTGIFTNLVANSYTIYAIDNNNCSVSTVVSINQPPAISIAAIQPFEPICHGDANGSLVILATGGVGPYQYSLDGGTLQTSGIFNGLVSKNYLITIVDANNCVHTENYFLTEPDIVGATITIRDANCIDSKDGRIDVVGTGGRGDYKYYIMPGLLFNKSGIFTGLAVGTYTLRVLDVANCEYTTVFTINPPGAPLGVTITKQDLGCTGKGHEGQATANVFGGLQPYSYLWFTAPVQTDAIADSLYFGWYQLQVTDANGCVVKDSVYIQEGPCCDVSFIPNAFSPNGDGNNDVFKVFTTAGVQLQQLEVFDRWGNKVWGTNNYRFGWDGNIEGKAAEVGTYYYVLRYKCTTNLEDLDKVYTKRGDVILIR